MSDGLRSRVLARAATAADNGATRFDALLADCLATLPDERRALVHLDRYLEASYSPQTVIDDFLRRPALAALFVRLVGVSGYAADLLVRDAQLFRWLTDGGGLEARATSVDMHAAARAAFDAFEREERRIASLKRWQRREMLGIIARDLTGASTLARTTADLSVLAAAVVGVLLAHAAARIEERFGARLDTPLVVFALGKLGGGELNYSSDIDLMAVYGAFETRTATVTTHDLAVRTIELLIHLLTTHDREGFLYRTDFRLRPDGAHGALALSRAATVAYYESRGAAWERQMLLKRRVIAGVDASADAPGSALAFGHALSAELDAFVHPRTRAGAPSALLAEVDARLRTRHTRTRDVKHFDGGIRSIEFTVQALQLLHGADATLRAAGTLAAIDRLAGAGILTDDEATRLRRAYQTLRRIEHMLQLDAFEQTHTLPEDEEARRRLAWALGLANAAELDDLVVRVRADVRAVTGAVFAMREDEGGGWSEPRLAELGFADPAGAFALVDALVRGRQRKPHAAALRARAGTMVDALLPELASTALPDNALRTLEQVVDGVQSAGHVVAYLEHPRTRAALVALAAHAPVQLRRVVTAPLVLDAVFGGRAAEAGMELGPELLRLVRDTDALVRWSLGGMSIAELGMALSDTADLIVRGMWDEVVGDAPMCMIALGKYGSRELMPGSDLDVVFVVRPDEGFSLADAEEAVRGVLNCGQGRPRSVPYEIDARLRPEGVRSPLVTSIDAYRRYLASRAVLWEKQSLLRMRPVAGDAGLIRELQTIFSETVAAVRPDAATAEAVVAMRLAMEPASRFRDDDHVDLKTGPGGLVDAEFAAQFHLLGSAPALPTPLANTFSALDAAVADPVRAHDRAHWSDLRESYTVLRTLQLHLRLVVDTPSNHPPADEAQRLLLARAAGAPDVRTLFATLHEARTRMRRAFLTLMRTGAHPHMRTGAQES